MLISHRFSTIRLANQILVLENGNIIEEGSHEELMRMVGLYEYLFKLQARGYEESGFILQHPTWPVVARTSR